MEHPSLSMIAPERRAVLEALGPEVISLICKRLAVDGHINGVEALVFTTILQEALQDTVANMVTAHLAKIFCDGK
jgi:hypothetical protein